MALEIKLNQKLSQTLVMTPQLQQAIKLLQLGRMEYLEVIENELLENPILEDSSDPDEPESRENQVTLEFVSGEEKTQSQSQDEASELSSSLGSNTATQSESGIDNHADQSMRSTDYDYEGFSSGASSGSSSSSSGDRERPSIEATVSSPEGLSSHLLWQLRTGDLSEDDRGIAAQIVGNLDRNGYLCCSIEELAQMCNREVEDCERVLAIVHTLDPVGIAARDLRECLLIQLDQMGLGKTLVGRIVAESLSDIELRRYDAIAKKEQVEVEEVYEAVKLIQRLEPRPGRPFVEEAPIYITPDIYVRKVGESYVLSLNESGLPKLRLNSHYQGLLAKGTTENQPDKEYLQDRIRSASWLIKSIHQRQQTIYRVSESIMKYQRDFLDRGVAHLKPLVLREIAADVGMHESTISRVTTNKYIHTPQGVFELKFFFTSGLKSGNGEVSSESVKERIRDLVAQENPKKPLSDQALVNALKNEGVEIARRTVAKYREMLGVLSSSRRKKVF